MTFMLNLISRYFEREFHSKEAMRIAYAIAYRFRMMENLGLLLYITALISGTLYLLSSGISVATSRDWMALTAIVLLYIIFLAILYFYRAFLETLRSMSKLLGEL